MSGAIALLHLLAGAAIMGICLVAFRLTFGEWPWKYPSK